MRSLVFPTLLLAGCALPPSVAENLPPLQATNSAGSTLIWKRPCHHANQTGFSYAEFHYREGSVEKGCWVMWSGAVILVFDDGDTMTLPQHVFELPGTRKAPGTL